MSNPIGNELKKNEATYVLLLQYETNVGFPKSHKISPEDKNDKIPLE